MKVAIYQYPIDSNPQRNVEKIVEQVTALKEEEVDLLVLPELCLTGYGAMDRSICFEESSKEIQALVDVTEKSRLAIVGGFAVKEGELYYNRILFIGNQQIQARYDKRKLFIFGGEESLFKKGETSKKVLYQGMNLAFHICFDLRFPELFRESVGAEVMIVIANWPASRQEQWRALLKARAIENQAYIVGVNRLGFDARNKVDYRGDSVIHGPKGEELLSLSDQESCRWRDLSKEKLHILRRSFPFLDSVEL